MIKVLAIANADSYLKWSATTLEQIVAECDAAGAATTEELVLVRGPITPSDRQIENAIAGSAIPRPRILSFAELRRHIAATEPDVVLMGCTGPVGEMIACAIARDLPLSKRPVFLSGMPGIYFVPKRKGASWRRWTDAFIVHSPAEVEPNRAVFERAGVAPDIVLTTLPFLESKALRPMDATPVSTIVFATQALPAEREQRVAILAGLAAAAKEGFRVVVKLRALKGEGQTHHEDLPYDELWDEVHEQLGFERELIEFKAGAMGDWLFPGAAVVTVSSTAALESLALGLRTVFLADFGVDQPTLHNLVYADSGCLVESADLPAVLKAGGPVPDEAWLKSTYLHGQHSELGATVMRLVERRRRGEDHPPARIHTVDLLTFTEVSLAARSPQTGRALAAVAKNLRRIIPPWAGAAIGNLRRALWARDIRVPADTAEQHGS